MTTSPLDAAHWESRWKENAGHVAWPTVIMMACIVGTYALVWVAYFYDAIHPALATLINAALTYLAFTPMHDASHGGVVGGRRGLRWLEEGIGWAGALMLFAPYPTFRVIHLEHHSHTNNPARDPDHFVAGGSLAFVVLKCSMMLAHYYHEFIFGEVGKTEAARRAWPGTIFGVTMLLVAVGTLVATGHWVALVTLWLLPVLFASTFLALVFDWLPHHPHALEERFRDTRIMLVPGATLPLLWQNYHLIHHLYPRVPFYRYSAVFQDVRPWLERNGAPIEGGEPTLPGVFGSDMRTPAGERGDLAVEIIALERPTKDAVTVRVRPIDGAFGDALPGQYLRLGVEVDGTRAWRCYSMCEPPAADGSAAVTIKRVPGGVVSTHMVEDAEVGQHLTARGPEGSFFWNPSPRPIVLLGGGSGITPLRHILEAALATPDGPPVALLYGNRSLADTIFGAHFAELAASHPEFTYLPVYEKPDGDDDGPAGRLDTPTLGRLRAELPPEFADAEFYICGPTPMMDAAHDALVASGVAEEAIHEERFVARKPKPRTSGTHAGEAFTARIERSSGDIEFPIYPDQTILDAAIEAGHDLPHSCGAGICGSCTMRVRSGEVERGDASALLDGEAKQGFLLTCVGKAKGDVVIVDEQP